LELSCGVLRRQPILTNLWTVGSSEQFYTDFLILHPENQDDRGAKAKRPGLRVG
jgi:hypothetical protein